MPSQPIPANPVPIGVQGTVDVNTGQAITTNATDESLDRFTARIMNELDAVKQSIPAPVQMPQAYRTLPGCGFTTGRFYELADFQGHMRPLLGSAGALTANTIYYFPFPCTQSLTAATLNVEVTGAVATSSLRMGIYTDTGTIPRHYNAPSTLVSGSDGGAVSTATTGNKQTTAVFSLKGNNWYWFALFVEKAISVQCYNGGSVPMLGVGTAASATFLSCMTQSLAFAALPATATSPAAANFPTFSTQARWQIGV